MRALLSFILIANMAFAQNKLETITLGSGCFWCTEAIFEATKGIEIVESGYMGGEVKKPSYKQVTSGLTGHAEVVKIQFDPCVISFKEILEIFWQTHDPTTLNRQGNDVGTQYRSAIFYTNELQKITAEQVKQELEKAEIWDNPIVTEITAASTFYKAEGYHQDYYELNKNKNPYCSYVITPKLEKFKKIFDDKVK